MIEFAQYWIAASYFVAIGLAIEQLRRPVSAWNTAGRERRFWVSLSLVSGFHGLGQFAAIAYFAAVVPRFRSARPATPRPAALRIGSALALRRGERTATEALALVAALLVFGSSFIHTGVTADHVDYWVPFGVAFGVATIAQAVWAALVYRAPLNRRVLVAGAVGNAAFGAEHHH